jgi:GT2 family glycosyltransferase
MVADLIIKKFIKDLPEKAVFSILIPTWNNLPYLQLCIEGIRKNSHFSHQIIVHVNEGKDQTLDWLERQPDISYTFSEQNIGICYALNIGRELVLTDYVLYMNDDMYVCPDWDLELWNEIRHIGHPYFFLSSTPIEPFGSDNKSVLVMDYGTDPKTFQEKALLDNFRSAGMADWQGSTSPPNIVHRDIWDLVGGYSIEFSPGMYSDPDFSMKLWQLGIRLFKGVGKSRVYHFGSKSTGRIIRNNGYFTFISKWGMSSSTLTRHLLRRGQPFDGLLHTPAFSFGLKLKNYFKRIHAAMWRKG